MAKKFTPANVLTVAFNEMKAHGYVKKSVADGQRWVDFNGRNTLVTNYVEQEGNTCRATLNALLAGDTSTDEELALKCIQSYTKFDGSHPSRFAHDMIDKCHKPYLTEEEVMQVAFIPVFYFNELKYEARKAAAQKEEESFKESLAEGFEGEINTSIVTKATLVKKGEFNGAYGLTFIYTFLSESKHLLVWFTTKDIEKEIGEIVSLKGCVKNHKEFKGMKQTIVTRCKVA